jgi:hypothetical protein
VDETLYKSTAKTRTTRPLGYSKSGECPSLESLHFKDFPTTTYWCRFYLPHPARWAVFKQFTLHFHWPRQGTNSQQPRNSSLLPNSFNQHVNKLST